jgi:hypothetical protein
MEKIVDKLGIESEILSLRITILKGFMQLKTLGYKTDDFVADVKIIEVFKYYLLFNHFIIGRTFSSSYYTSKK